MDNILLNLPLNMSITVCSAAGILQKRWRKDVENLSLSHEESDVQCWCYEGEWDDEYWFKSIMEQAKWSALACAKNPKAKDKWAIPDNSSYQDSKLQKINKMVIQDSADKKL